MTNQESVTNQLAGGSEQLTLDSALRSPEIIAPTTDVRLRAAHLIQALGFLGEVNRRDIFITAQHSNAVQQQLMDRIGAEGFVETASKAIKAHNNFQKAARTEFRSAYQVGMGPIDQPEMEQSFLSAFGNFYARYSGSRHKTERHTYLANLQYVAALSGPANKADSYVLETRPKPDQAPNIAQKLTKQEKLDIFEQDIRLQFSPATNREEEQARRALNYIDHPHGVLAMLDEIAMHNFKLARADDLPLTLARRAGSIARQSVVMEFGDYLDNAITQLKHLTALEATLAGLNPKLTLAEALADIHYPAVATMLREADYDQFRSDGQESLGFDPLKTRVNRRQPLEPGKRKTIEDHYTGQTDTTIITERIADWCQSLTVGEVQRSRLIESAIIKQTNRANFWEHSVLRRTEGADKRVAKTILSLKHP